MPTLQEFLDGFGAKEIALSIFIAAIIIFVREYSPLGIFRRKKSHDK